tara:strand:- start:2119 stop:2400 length:282 start_codon:yes stop_codon:yes gene_type:complete
MAIYLEKNGVQKKVSTGFSWKSLFFGLFYTIARGDMKGFFLQFGLMIVTGGLHWFVLPFVYNTRFIKRLLIDGYKPKDNKAKNYLIKKIGYNG